MGSEMCIRDRFIDVEVRSAGETIEETAEHGLKVIRTTSGYLRIDPARRDAFEADVRALYARLGGTSRFPLLTVLVTAVRPA